jgi:hypothetical protein
MKKTTDVKLESLNEKVHNVCYSFYRYEINNGLVHMNALISGLTEFLAQHEVEEEQLKEMNQLFELVQQAIENKDFLIAADVLKHELLERMLRVVSSST